MAGAEKKMIGVAEDYAGLQFVPQVALIKAFHRRLRSDRHEGRSRNVAVLCVENPGASAGDRAFGDKFERDLTRQSRLYCATLDLWQRELSFRALQGVIYGLLFMQPHESGIHVFPELRVQVGPARFRIPDISVTTQKVRG